MLEIISYFACIFQRHTELFIGLFIQGFIAYHVYALSKQISIRTRLANKEKIKLQIEKLLSEINNKGLSRKVYLVNINRYFKDYPSNDEKIFEGYSHIRADVKTTKFDGIEFFSDMPIGIRHFSKKDAIINAYPVGVVPYDWIEHIDLNGDEYGGVPLIYCHFRGRTHWKFWRRLLFFGYPYKRIIYYVKSEVYREGRDPADMEYRFIGNDISKILA